MYLYSFFLHCVKSVQTRSLFRSVFSRIWTEYREILRISPHSVQMRENTDQKKPRIWALFTQCYIKSIVKTITTNTHNHITYAMHDLHVFHLLLYMAKFTIISFLSISSSQLSTNFSTKLFLQLQFI